MLVLDSFFFQRNELLLFLLKLLNKRFLLVFKGGALSLLSAKLLLYKI